MQIKAEAQRLEQLTNQQLQARDYLKVYFRQIISPYLCSRPVVMSFILLEVIAAQLVLVNTSVMSYA